MKVKVDITSRQTDDTGQDDIIQMTTSGEFELLPDGGARLC